MAAKIAARHGEYRTAANISDCARKLYPTDTPKIKLTPKEIRREVCGIIEQECGISIEEVRKPNRKTAVKEARHYYAYFLYKYGRMSLKQVGKRIMRHYSTVIHSKVKLTYLVDTEVEHQKRFDRVTEKIEMAIGT